jgi:DNA replication protein DnaC
MQPTPHEIELLLAELRLPAMKLMCADLAARADKEGWPASRFLGAFVEHEIADSGCRRIERRPAGAKLPTGKRLTPSTSGLGDGDSWLDQGAYTLFFGPPGGGKPHLAAALGLALVQQRRRAQFILPKPMNSGVSYHSGDVTRKPKPPHS